MKTFYKMTDEVSAFPYREALEFTALVKQCMHKDQENSQVTEAQEVWSLVITLLVLLLFCLWTSYLPWE